MTIRAIVVDKLHPEKTVQLPVSDVGSFMLGKRLSLYVILVCWNNVVGEEEHVVVDPDASDAASIDHAIARSVKEYIGLK